MDHLKCWIFSFILSSLIYSCKKADDPNMPTVSNTVTILYLEANNDLRQEARKAINDLEQGSSKSNNTTSLILAYVKDNDRYGYLLKISPDNNTLKISSDTLKAFDASDPSGAAQISNVLTYIRNSYQANYYNLILWSHGTAWAPAAQFSSQPKTRSFGEDRGNQIDILDLKDALPMHFNYIIFDACSMASVEVLFEFRNKANYIIASPTDVLSDGFPYQNILPHINSGSKEDVKKIASAYFNYYNVQTGLHRSATISVIDLSRLESLSKYISSLDQEDGRSLSTVGVQRMDFTHGFPVPLYDFGDFISKNYSYEHIASIEKLLEDALVYKNNTPEFLGNTLHSFSGLTLSALPKSDPYYPYYANLEWSKRTKIYLPEEKP